MQKTFTIEEIKNYILSMDSLGDVLYFLSEEKIIEANKNEPAELDEDEVISQFEAIKELEEQTERKSLFELTNKYKSGG